MCHAALWHVKFICIGRHRIFSWVSHLWSSTFIKAHHISSAVNVFSKETAYAVLKPWKTCIKVIWKQPTSTLCKWYTAIVPKMIPCTGRTTMKALLSEALKVKEIAKESQSASSDSFVQERDWLKVSTELNAVCCAHLERKRSNCRQKANALTTGRQTVMTFCWDCFRARCHQRWFDKDLHFCS